VNCPRSPEVGKELEEQIKGKGKVVNDACE
jgi:hypothetical protein